jgi:hypothetical protein
MTQEFNLSKERKNQFKDIEYLFSKINWSKSFLDADAIRIMNEFRGDILKADKEFVRRLKEKLYDDKTPESYAVSKGIIEIIDKLAGESKK